MKNDTREAAMRQKLGSLKEELVRQKEQVNACHPKKSRLTGK